MKEKTRRHLKICSWVLIFVAIVGAIPLTLEVFGEMRSEYVTAFAIVTAIGVFGANICTFIWGVTGLGRKHESD